MCVYRGVYMRRRLQDVRSGAFLNGRTVGEARRRGGLREQVVAAAVVALLRPRFQHQTVQIDSFGCQQTVLGLAGLTAHVHHVQRIRLHSFAHSLMHQHGCGFAGTLIYSCTDRISDVGRSFSTASTGRNGNQ